VDFVNLIANATSCVAAIAAVVVALYVNYEAKLPDVIAYLEHDSAHGCIYLVVKNFGRGVARNVQVQGFDFAMAESDMKPYLEKMAEYLRHS
jgi:anti-sigma-K factor RskA